MIEDAFVLDLHDQMAIDVLRDCLKPGELVVLMVPSTQHATAKETADEVMDFVTGEAVGVSYVAATAQRRINEQSEAFLRALNGDRTNEKVIDE